MRLFGEEEEAEDFLESQSVLSRQRLSSRSIWTLGNAAAIVGESRVLEAYFGTSRPFCLGTILGHGFLAPPPV